MIQYNKVEIKDGKLVLSFKLEDKPYYENCSITGVIVDTSLTYGTEHHFYEHKGEDFMEYVDEIPISNSPRELFIITPLVVVNVPADAPCGADVINKAVIYDDNFVLAKSLDYIKGVGSTCELSRDFIDFILRKHALDAAIATCNYHVAIKYWNMINSNNKLTSIGCGCYGK